ncbi:MAG: BamA/TamA family outer membrane protein [Candidatus Eremiobacteraeota bacterium]|nr:BamA/TamA family outer membrane protein [Candidatus Eremiobacteraeota bacterium]
MTFDPTARVGRFQLYAGILLPVLALLASLAPSRPAVAAAAPKIVSVDVSGNLHVPTSTIMAVVEARPGQPYNPRIVQADLARINALGYFADIAPPLVRPRPRGVAITYRVVENPVLTKIGFTGNTKVPGDTLLALMDLSVGQVFNTNTFRQDVLKINNYYERIGYGGQVPTHVKDINLDPKTGALTLVIQEGLVVKNIVIGGDPLLPPTLILPALTLKAGNVYSDAVRDADYKSLQKLYEDKFHLEVGNFEGGIVPSSIDLQAGTADVKYNIYVARVAVVEITGNTRTKDRVIRRELRERPGMVLNTDAIKRDYERLQALNFFSKVEPDVRPGPDPKKPQDVTVVWRVTEQRTATASLGFGYSGGLTGLGLYGTLGFSDNNLHGTGNSAGIQFEEGARTGIAQITASIPYLSNTPQGERYTAGASIFTNHSTYYYPVYSIAGTGSAVATRAQVPIPVTLYPSSTSQQLTNIVATSSSSATGASANIGRRLSDYTILSLNVSGQKIKYDTTVPSPYYFQGNQPNIFVGPTPGPLNSTPQNFGGSFGIAASSIANVNTGAPYNLATAGISLQTITLDDPFNPRNGIKGLLNSTFSAPAIGSNFSFTQSTLDLAKFFPVLRSATLGLHGVGYFSTGVIPPSSLFTFSDQQMRGYNQVFYATNAYLGQVELRQPLSIDRRITLAVFVDELDYRIRGAYPLLNPYTNRITGYPGDWALYGDAGFGVRFDVPQLGLRTVRIDFARGHNGTHTSFGIGQSF